MTILVTGSAGFIGFHLSKLLLSAGEEIVGLDNMNAYYDVALKQERHRILGTSNRFSAHVVELADKDAVSKLVAAARPRLVVHLAAQAGVRHALKAPQDYISSNVVGTFNLLEACKAHPPQHLMMASTSSVYGASTAMPFSEHDSADTALTIYSASKRSTEVIAHSYAHLWNMPITVFRFFSVYGTWGRPDMALFKFTDSILKGEPIDIYNHGRMERDFTYVEDLVEAIRRLSPCTPTRGAPVCEADSLSPVAPFRIVNIGRGSPVNLMDFIAEIERCVGKPAIKNMVDMQPGDVPKTWADAGLLQTLTGFVPNTPISVGVEAFVRWFREYYRR